MVNRKAAMSAALKYGPALAAAAKRYGPTVLEQLNKQREPAERLVRERRERGNPRRTAINHASTVIDGTLLRGYHRGQEFWVVFSGDDPVGVYPYTTVPYAVLLDHADLGRRLRPDQARRRAQTPRRSGGSAAGAGPTAATPRPDAEAPRDPGPSTGRGRLRALRPGEAGGLPEDDADTGEDGPTATGRGPGPYRPTA